LVFLKNITPERLKTWCLLAILLITGNIAFGQIKLSVTVTNVSDNVFNGNGIFYNGSVTVTASGGSAPYTYNFSTFPPTRIGYFPTLAAGSYPLSVTDAKGNTVVTTVVISSKYPLPSVSLSNVVVPSSCTSADGSFTVIGSGGTPPYTYSIDGGATFVSSNTFTNLYQGYYFAVLLKDANGCLALTGTSPITALETPANPYFGCNCCKLNAFAYSPVSSCTNTGSIAVNAIGGTGPFQYSIDSISYFTGITGYGFNNLQPGLYHTYVKDGAGDTAVAIAQVVKFCTINITLVSVAASCHESDGSLTVTAVNGVAPYSYTIDGINYQPGNVFTGLAEGNYNVTVRGANGETNSASATVYNKCPVLSTSVIDELCGQKNGVIKASGSNGVLPYMYAIDYVGIFMPDSVFKGLSAGTYKIIMRDGTGSVDSASVTVGNNCLTATSTVINATCSNKNGSITITGSGGTAPYQYALNGGSYQSDAVFPGLDSGNYTISVQDVTGLTRKVVIHVGGTPVPVVSAASTSANCDGTGGSITITGKGGTAPFQYSLDGNSFQNSNKFINDTAGVYVATIKDANGCMASDSVEVTKYFSQQVSLGNNDTLCNGGQKLLTAPTGINYRYQWQDGSTGSTYTARTTGYYWVKITNQDNCIAMDTVHIEFKPLPAFSLGKDTSLCNGQPLNFNIQVTGGTYLWSTGSTASSLSINTGGTYWLRVSNSGCASADTITVSFKPLPIVVLGNDTALCSGTTLLLSATNNNSTYLWQDGSTQPTYNVANSGTYTVKVNMDGCDATGKIAVKYITAPVVNIGSDTLLCVNDKLVLNAAYPQTTYLWQDGSTLPTLTVSAEGNYSVKATNICGTTIQSVNVQYENCSCEFYIPTAFTPNGDGKNDVFKPAYKCFFSQYQLKVFNRFGENIFTSHNVGDGWDGTVNNLLQPIGTYIWEIVYLDTLTGKLVKKNGTLVLIR